MTIETELTLPPLDGDVDFTGLRLPEATGSRAPSDLERLFDVPVTVSAILGHASMPVGDLLKIGPGSLIELDRKVGEAVDILVNDRLVARGEVVLADDRLGVTLTEIVTTAR